MEGSGDGGRAVVREVPRRQPADYPDPDDPDERKSKRKRRKKEEWQSQILERLMRRVSVKYCILFLFSFVEKTKPAGGCCPKKEGVSLYAEAHRIAMG